MQKYLLLYEYMIMFHFENAEIKINKQTNMGTAAWTRIARDRREWKCYEEGFVQRLDEL